jgi:hypothetical protein
MMLSEDEASVRLDRHALVLAVWLPAGFVALGLLHYGFGPGGAWWVAAGFGALLAGFVAHVIVNAVLGTIFTVREAGLGMALYAIGMVALVLAVLLGDGFAVRFFLPVAAGMIALLLAAVFYMLTRFGTRDAFDKFDIIRNNNPRRASRLIRGGRQ